MNIFKKIYDLFTQAEDKMKKRQEISDLANSEVENFVKEARKRIPSTFEVQHSDVLDSRLVNEFAELLEKNNYSEFLRAFLIASSKSNHYYLIDRLYNNFPDYFKVDLEYFKKGPKVFEDYLKKYPHPHTLFEEIQKLKKPKVILDKSK